MKYFSQSMTLLGKVTNVNVKDASFTLRCRSGDTFLVQASSQTTYNVLRNLDELGRDRVPTPQNFNPGGGISEMLRKYVQPDETVIIYGIYQEHEGKKQFQASTITLAHYEKGRYIFEESHWWLTQFPAWLMNGWMIYLVIVARIRWTISPSFIRPISIFRVTDTG